VSILKKRASLYFKLRRLMVLGGVAGVINAIVPAQATAVGARQLLEDRVQAVRSAIYESTNVESGIPSDTKLAQWMNWGNWNNWNNWPNWGNWANWFNR
jgi:hypothetical protein